MMNEPTLGDRMIPHGAVLPLRMDRSTLADEANLIPGFAGFIGTPFDGMPDMDFSIGYCQSMAVFYLGPNWYRYSIGYLNFTNKIVGANSGTISLSTRFATSKPASGDIVDYTYLNGLTAFTGTYGLSGTSSIGGNGKGGVSLKLTAPYLLIIGFNSTAGTLQQAVGAVDLDLVLMP